MVVPDVDDVFAPLPASACLCNVHAGRHLIESALDLVVQLSSEHPAGTNAFGAATKAAFHILVLFIFHIFFYFFYYFLNPLQNRILCIAHFQCHTCVLILLFQQQKKYFQENTGGKAIIFQSALPSVGFGKLANREQLSLYGTDREQILYLASNEMDYLNLANQAADKYISYDVFVATQGFADIPITCMTFISFFFSSPCLKFGCFHFIFSKALCCLHFFK